MIGHAPAERDRVRERRHEELRHICVGGGHTGHPTAVMDHQVAGRDQHVEGEPADVDTGQSRAQLGYEILRCRHEHVAAGLPRDPGQPDEQVAVALAS